MAFDERKPWRALDRTEWLAALAAVGVPTIIADHHFKLADSMQRGQLYIKDLGWAKASVDPADAARLVSASRATFGAVDTDADGVIDDSELITLLTTLAIPEANAREIYFRLGGAALSPEAFEAFAPAGQLVRMVNARAEPTVVQLADGKPKQNIAYQSQNKIKQSPNVAKQVQTIAVQQV